MMRVKKTWVRDNRPARAYLAKFRRLCFSNACLITPLCLPSFQNPRHGLLREDPELPHLCSCTLCPDHRLNTQPFAELSAEEQAAFEQENVELQQQLDSKLEQLRNAVRATHRVLTARET
jgi:hypothetical protein